MGKSDWMCVCVWVQADIDFSHHDFSGLLWGKYWLCIGF